MHAVRVVDVEPVLDVLLRRQPVRLECLGDRRAVESLNGNREVIDGSGRALLAQPRVLLMDEPCLGLAPKVGNEVYEVLRELRSEGQSLIIVEEKAHVTARLTAAQITVAGTVDGQIYCEGRVEIRPTGHVTGEINAGALIVQEGAYFDGNSKMATGGSLTPPVSNTNSSSGRQTSEAARISA